MTSYDSTPFLARHSGHTAPRSLGSLIHGVQRRFRHCEAAVPAHESNFVTPSSIRRCSAGTFIGPGAGASPGFGCGNAVDIAEWNVDVSFHLLHHLVDMPVEHRNGSEGLQQRQEFSTVLRAPAPLRINAPQRN